MTAISSNGSGVWSATGSWAGGVVPTENDTVTILNTHTITLDASVTVGADTTTPAIQIAAGGKLEVLSTVAASLDLTLKGDLKVTGTLEIGTVANPIPANRKVRLLLNYSAALADGKYGLIIQAAGTCTMQGNALSYDRALLAANNGGTCSTVTTAVTKLEGPTFVGLTGTIMINGVQYTIASVTDATHLTLTGTAGTQTAVAYVPDSTSLTLTTDVSTGWLDNDMIGIASTDRTYTHCEKALLNGNASTTTLTIDGAGGTGGGLLYGHMGTSPIQAEIINLTRNVVVTAQTAASVGYVVFETTATVNIDWVEFSYLGENATDKTGIVIKTTSGSCSLNRCAAHDFEDGGYFLSGSAVNNVTISDCVGYGLATAASFSINVPATSGTSWSITNLWCVYQAQNAIMWNILDLGGTLTGCRAIGSAGQGIQLFEAAVITGTFSDLVGHSCGWGGLWLRAMWGGTISTLTQWRDNQRGLFLGICVGVTIDGVTVFGCNNASITLEASSVAGLRVVSGVFSGDSTFATASGILVSNLDVSAVFEGCTFGVASGIKVAHTQDVLLQNNAYADLTFINCVLASATEVNGQAVLAANSRVGSQKHDQTKGAHKSWFKYGTITSDATEYRTAAPSERLTPNNASGKLASAVKTVCVDDTATKTISVYVKQSAAYNGAQPRLIVKANVSAGIAADTVLDTDVGAVGSWRELTGTTAAVTDDAVLEVYVDVDGTAGFVSVDDWSAT